MLVLGNLLSLGTFKIVLFIRHHLIALLANTPALPIQSFAPASICMYFSMYLQGQIE